MTREEKKELALKILSIVAAAGFLTAAVVAPGIVLVGPLFMGRRRMPKHQLDPAIRFALRSRWLKVRQETGRSSVVLTDNGRRQVLKADFGENAVPVPPRWDGQWRIVIFDIPNKLKLAREIFRDTLKRMGFRQLQESVWLHPYPCEKVVTDLVTLYCIKPFVQVLLVRRFSGEGKFLHQFSLEK